MCWACGVYVSEEKLYKCELCAVDRFCEKCIVMAQCACTKREGTWKDYYAFISKQMEKKGKQVFVFRLMETFLTAELRFRYAQLFPLGKRNLFFRKTAIKKKCFLLFFFYFGFSLFYKKGASETYHHDARKFCFFVLAIIRLFFFLNGREVVFYQSFFAIITRRSWLCIVITKYYNFPK